ncbi:MAG TPA: helix-turn-helix domain-containing protein [Actinomycetales bacterium]|nr:helix-turn-helix domain-containing protein [Actinomycetales bacterium]
MSGNARDTVERLTFTIREVAQMVGQSESTVRRAIKSGALRARYLSEHPAIHRDDIEAWIAGAPTERRAS